LNSGSRLAARRARGHCSRGFDQARTRIVLSNGRYRFRFSDSRMRFEEGSSHLRCSCLLTLGLVSCCVAPLCAQTAPDAQAGVSVLKANALAVAVDVVVTRGNGEPVLSLRKQDFQVLEDGKPQPIDLFEEHTATSSPTAARRSDSMRRTRNSRSWVMSRPMRSTRSGRASPSTWTSRSALGRTL